MDALPGNDHLEINASDVAYLKLHLLNPTVISIYIIGEEFRIDWGTHTNSETKFALKQGYHKITIYGKKISDLRLVNCFLTEVDVSCCVSLITLSCSYNQLKKLILPKSSTLKHLYFQYNQIHSINLHRYIHLEDLVCNNNLLRYLDLRSCKEIHHVDCSNNRLVSFHIEGCFKLNYLRCNGNLLSQNQLLIMLANFPEYTGFSVGRTNYCQNPYISLQVHG